MRPALGPTSAGTTDALLPVQLANAAAHVENHLRTVLDGEMARGTPERLVSAMRHAVLGAGKRIRPFLLLQSAGLFNVMEAEALTAAAALELIHCYSLVHDDLPSMDNDTLRRGQPTVWAAFDEWTAILAGDALQTLAFELLADCVADQALATRRLELVSALARASGAAGMVGGQVYDLEAGKLGMGPGADAAHIARLQAMKTGRLISVACDMGAILGTATAAQRQALTRYGDAIGFAFQISDDLLDAEGSAEAVGKATGKDAAAGKATLVSLLGITQARGRLDAAIAEAIAALDLFDDRANALREAARFMGRRES
jgi:farnesyl diphosphate synthase